MENNFGLVIKKHLEVVRKDHFKEELQKERSNLEEDKIIKPGICQWLIIKR